MAPLMRFLGFVAFMLVTVLASCSALQDSKQSISITTNDPQAEIFVDGAGVGRGSASVQVARNKTHSIMARVGERSASASTSKSVSATGWLDVIGGFFFLIPWIGIVTPGFWELDQTNFSLSLPPAG